MAQSAALLHEATFAGPLLPAAVPADNFDQVYDLALLNLQAVVHPSFSGTEGRITSDLQDDPPVQQADGNRLQLWIRGAEAIDSPGMVDDRQLPPFNQPGECLVEQPHAGTITSRTPRASRAPQCLAGLRQRSGRKTLPSWSVTTSAPPVTTRRSIRSGWLSRSGRKEANAA